LAQSDLAVCGKLFVEGEFYDGTVVLRGGKISEIRSPGEIPSGVEQLDFGNLWVLPGLVDVHTHLRDFGEREKEDFESGTRAAVAGGFSSIIAMPNTVPPLNSPARFSGAIEAAKNRIFCDVGFHCGLPDSLEEAREMRSDGAFSMKLYPEDLTRLTAWMRGMDAAQLNRTDLTLYVHAEDEDCVVQSRASFGKDLRGATMHGEVRPPRCELLAIEKTMGAFGECDLHFAHITTKDGMEAIGERLKSRTVSAEATVHHLSKTDAEVLSRGGVAKVNPPLRSARDVEALRRGVNQGLISIVVSDHAPHTLAEKQQRDYDKIPSGTPGLETALSAMLKSAKAEQLDLVETINCMTKNPARRFGLEGNGRISPGSLANITVVDPNETWKVDPESFFSKAKYSLFEGEELVGRVKMTMVRGLIAYEDGYVTEKPRGEVLRRRPA